MYSSSVYYLILHIISVFIISYKETLINHSLFKKKTFIVFIIPARITVHNVGP
jgi:hypothetical protein